MRCVLPYKLPVRLKPYKPFSDLPDGDFNLDFQADSLEFEKHICDCSN